MVTARSITNKESHWKKRQAMKNTPRVMRWHSQEFTTRLMVVQAPTQEATQLIQARTSPLSTIVTTSNPFSRTTSPLEQPLTVLEAQLNQMVLSKLPCNNRCIITITSNTVKVTQSGNRYLRLGPSPMDKVPLDHQVLPQFSLSWAREVATCREA